MELTDAVRMIMSESARHPELLRVARTSYDDLSSGRPVHHTALSGMLRQAARKNVYPALRARYGVEAINDMVLALGREIDRQAPAVRR
ncbi:hypothetical protein [Actinomadura keratinilytica]|jgi:hypothetical protein|uniref:Uncharacterized protein n=1 Tax=Actinomadura keratinilytica TaxID=547461 RepID=A0ABP7ZBX0_9ACTN